MHVKTDLNMFFINYILKTFHYENKYYSAKL